MQEKVPLPTKTKIAVWWMIIFGGIIIIDSLRLMSLWAEELPLGAFFAVLFFYFPIGVLVFLLPGLSLLKRKKFGWYWSIIILFIGLVVFIPFLWPSPEYDIWVQMRATYPMYYIIFISYLPLFILLFLDRKNFWKIAN